MSISLRKIIVTILTINIVSSIKIELQDYDQSHKFFRSFFGQLTEDSPGYSEYNLPQNVPKQQQKGITIKKQANLLNKQANNKIEQTIQINGKPYKYQKPFRLSCYDKNDNLLRKDQCSKESICMKLLKQYKNCEGTIKYLQI